MPIGVANARNSTSANVPAPLGCEWGGKWTLSRLSDIREDSGPLLAVVYPVGSYFLHPTQQGRGQGKARAGVKGEDMVGAASLCQL
jgi:hypothetical protein